MLVQGDVLHQDDFNAICKFGKLISSRPQGELISHEARILAAFHCIRAPFKCQQL